MVTVLIGPMGCGKTTIGRMLARRIGCGFKDADDYHPPGNIAKMRQGIPLHDDDRAAWLATLAALIERHRERPGSLVLACSALKHRYREILGVNQIDVVSVYLKGSLQVLEQRTVSRNHQYMPHSLLRSQLEDLEEPVDGITVDIRHSPEAIVQIILERLGAPLRSPGDQEERQR